MSTARIVETDRLLDGDLRLDGAYYCSPGEDTRRWLGASHVRLERVAEVAERIFIGGRSRRIYVQPGRDGIPFLSSSDILLADVDGAPRVSPRMPSLAHLILDHGWTLISRSGTIGNVAYANANLAGKAASEHVMRVVPNGRVLPGFLFTWLASRWGVGLLKQGTFGSVIETIEPDYVADLPVPRLGEAAEQGIHDLVEQAAAKRVEANRLLRQAREMVYEVTGLPRIDPCPVGRNLNGARAFAVNQSELGNRFEGRYHDIIVRDLREQIREAGNWARLEDVTSSVYEEHRHKLYDAADNHLPYIGSGDMFSARPQPSRYVSRRIPGIDSLVVQPGTILVAKSGQIYSILGDAVFVGRSLARFAVSWHALRIVPDPRKLHPGFLFAFLTLSGYGYGQIVATAYGTSIPEISTADVKQAMVSLPSSADAAEVGDEVMRAIDLRDQANDLEDAAQALLQRALESTIGHSLS